ncbi:type II secretion system minor pseudopilin GspH [Musicola paradisiaca]|uniref:Type II secretion system protein H n=1 Tax=Musicola paradisiaca (strain Ech703) TaxID=579405 RepID=C6C309_MUSP7|nr:type II secretion system minor pseudopilin GspH [Musicola paradisiaca]ACS85274.1 general secretion pathway protein H [Musicola paradisiaca Ech703]
MRQRGFTLLEIMLVVLLAGVAATLIMMAIPTPKRQDSGWQIARFQAQLQYAVEESQMNDQILGIYVQPHRWQYALLQRQVVENSPEDRQQLRYQWQPWLPYRLSQPNELPASFEMELTVQAGAAGDGAGFSPGNGDPNILILPGGEVTPFRLTLRNGSSTAWLQVDTNGFLTMSPDARQ